MDRVRCRELWRNLADLVGEGKPGPAPLEAHLGECPACATLVARARSTARLLRSLPVVPAPAHLEEGIWEHLLAWDEASGRPGRLAELFAGLTAGRTPAQPVVPDRVEDPRVAHLLEACRPVSAPAQLDALVSQSVRGFLWKRSRESRVLRFVAGALAAAASLLLCVSLWAPVESPRPRLLIQDELAPPMGWESPESIHARLHGLLGRGPVQPPGGRPAGR